MNAGRARELVTVTLGFLFLTLAAVYPLSVRPATLARSDNADGLYSIWVVGWVAHQLTSNPLHLFDANIFFPLGHTLAFSESTVISGVMGIPVYLLSGDATLTHNVVLILTFVLTGLGMFLLVRRLTGSSDAGLIAGVIFAFCPFRFAHVAHIQLEMTQWIPFAFLALDRFAEKPSLARAILLAGCYVVTVLSCGYYGIYLTFTLAMAGIYFAAANRGASRTLAFWRGAVVAAALAVLAISPVLYVHNKVRVEYQFGRTADDLALTSAHLGSYLASGSRLHLAVLPHVRLYVEPLFPGFVALLLMLSLIAGRGKVAARSSAPRGGAQPPFGLFLLLALFFAWFSFGPSAYLYRWLYDYVPLVDMLRAPARAGIMVEFVVAMLAGLGFARLRARLRVSGRKATVWTAAAVVLILAEFWCAPLRLFGAPRIDVGYRALQHAPAGAIAIFPFPVTYRRLSEHALYMYESTAHWRPMVNGYSDIIPPQFLTLMDQVRSFPSDASLEALQRAGVRYVLFHLDLVRPADRQKLLDWLQQHKEVLRFRPPGGQVLVYELLRIAPRLGGSDRPQG